MDRKTVVEIAAKASQVGSNFLDAPVSGGRQVLTLPSGSQANGLARIGPFKFSDYIVKQNGQHIQFLLLHHQSVQSTVLELQVLVQLLRVV